VKYLKKKPQLLLLAVFILGLLVIIFDTLEDTFIEGGPFTGTPIDTILNVIIAITQNATLTVSSWGYVGILFLMLLESSSLPIPSEVILPFAGYLVSQGQLNLYLTTLLATVAGIAGSMIDYYIGMKGSRILTKQKALDKILHNKGTLQTANSWFKKYGSAAVVLSRMAPGIRTLLSFPAGAAKMPLFKFII
jgi:membrane protein DedA with SNARE-associated domain